MNNTPEYVIAKYDRLRGGLEGLFTKPSTIANVERITGKAETFVVETCRNDEMGDYIFVQMIDENGAVTRMALPPKVSNVIASQRESLTARRRRAAGVQQAKLRKERGEVPGFLRGKRKK